MVECFDVNFLGHSVKNEHLIHTCLNIVNRPDFPDLKEHQHLNLCSHILKCSEQIVNQFTSHHFIQFLHLLENESPYVSYSAKELIANIYLLLTMQEDDKQLKDFVILFSQFISHLISQILEKRTVNDVALMHIFDLVVVVLDKEDEHGKKSIKQLVIQHWNVFTEYAFSSQRDNVNEESLIYSTLKMYIKIIKSDREMTSASKFKFDLAQNLLEKMKSIKIPQPCLRKALMLIFHCCPEFDGKTSNFKNDTFEVSNIFFALTENHNEFKSIDEPIRSSSGPRPWLCDVVMRETPRSLFIGRGNGQESGPKSCDDQLLVAALLVVMKYTTYLTGCEVSMNNSVHQIQDSNKIPGLDKVWDKGFRFIFNSITNLFPCSHNQYKQLINILCDQDDVMIKFLLFTLQAAILSGSEDILMTSHKLFLAMLLTIHWNHSTLVDWLTSPETVFLQLLLKLLKSVLSKPQLWKSSCCSFDASFGLACSDQLQKVENSRRIISDVPLDSTCKTNRNANLNLTAYSDSEDSDEESQASTPFQASSFSFVKSRNVFIATADSIRKLESAKVFPYNPSPLLRLLDRFRDL